MQGGVYCLAALGWVGVGVQLDQMKGGWGPTKHSADILGFFNQSKNALRYLQQILVSMVCYTAVCHLQAANPFCYDLPTRPTLYRARGVHMTSVCVLGVCVLGVLLLSCSQYTSLCTHTHTYTLTNKQTHTYTLTNKQTQTHLEWWLDRQPPPSVAQEYTAPKTSTAGQGIWKDYS